VAVAIEGCRYAAVILFTKLPQYCPVPTECVPSQTPCHHDPCFDFAVLLHCRQNILSYAINTNSSAHGVGHHMVQRLMHLPNVLRR
jgi:hypothetical protein